MKHGEHLTRPATWAWKLFPIAMLIIVVVLGGIYGGVVTPTEAGASGSLLALLIALAKRRMSWKDLWEVLVETGHITATILFLLIAASMYSRMLGVSRRCRANFGDWLQGSGLTLTEVMILYVIMLVLLGTIIDTASIILIVAPLFLPSIEAFGGEPRSGSASSRSSGAEIGLLTPPLGISCFCDQEYDRRSNDISLYDIFAGACAVCRDHAARPDGALSRGRGSVWRLSDLEASPMRDVTEEDPHRRGPRDTICRGCRPAGFARSWQVASEAPACVCPGERT